MREWDRELDRGGLRMRERGTEDEIERVTKKEMGEEMV